MDQPRYAVVSVVITDRSVHLWDATAGAVAVYASRYQPSSRSRVRGPTSLARSHVGVGKAMMISSVG